MSVKNNSTTIAQKTAMLSELVAWFDGDDFELEKALDKFSEAQALATEIEEDLSALKNSISIVNQSFDQA